MGRCISLNTNPKISMKPSRSTTATKDSSLNSKPRNPNSTCMNNPHLSHLRWCNSHLKLCQSQYPNPSPRNIRWNKMIRELLILECHIIMFWMIQKRLSPKSRLKLSLLVRKASQLKLISLNRKFMLNQSKTKAHQYNESFHLQLTKNQENT